ncbi:MAG: arsenosugar biosynthesis radical SAM protein ArsS [Campylobacteraceae bacterium]|nr:arsenosugar biosynthesis radical SAM protein ArsS [Campylobacteraceae bacterium]
MSNFWENRVLLKNKFDLIQINIGDLCNLSCKHCHVGASPKGVKNMNKDTALKIIDKILSMKIQTIEFTGGTPEMNDNFLLFLEKLFEGGKTLVVRTSLTVLEDEKYSHFIDIYIKYKVKVIASLPSVFEETTSKQRGKGVYDSTIELLRRFNTMGYGKGDLNLDLVYNPVGTFLPAAQSQLELEYKTILKEKFDVSFNSLATIVNMPIKRFKFDLNKHKVLDEYMNTLRSKYNENTLDNIMCRNILSIDYEGYVYDCDFNLSLEMRIKAYENTYFWDIDFSNFKPEISFDSHCYACTVNSGSSCSGEVLKEKAVNTKEEEMDYQENAKEYYGEILSSSSDLKTSACCTIDMIPKRIKDTLPYIMDEIKDKYYGCGSPMPEVLQGAKILDLGCGSGRDVYILSKLTGQEGFVYGIDMTKNQIDVAKKYQNEQTRRFEYKKNNTSFIHDYIENIDKHFKENSLDIVTSNCVINLLKDKKEILKKVHTLLKEGGEFYFSDVYSNRRLGQELKTNKLLHGECLGGALYVNDFITYAIEAGFVEPRLVSSKEIEILDPNIKELLGNIKFYSLTYRLWKIKNLDSVCEDYGQSIIYKGGIEYCKAEFLLDANHLFEINRPEHVCKNTADMLMKTRYKKYFELQGNSNTHFGEFKACATLASMAKNEEKENGVVACC